MVVWPQGRAGAKALMRFSGFGLRVPESTLNPKPKAVHGLGPETLWILIPKALGRGSGFRLL